MKSVIVCSLYDKNGRMFNLLDKSTGILETNFQKVVLSISRETESKFKRNIDKIRKHKVFDIHLTGKNFILGLNLNLAYKYAAKKYIENTILHLCAIDRLLYVLLSKNKEKFLKDMSGAAKLQNPTLFLRSKKAWETHPKNYFACESMMTSVGKVLFGKELDFAWNHITMKSKMLEGILEKDKFQDIRFYAQFVLSLKDVLKTKKVDWLSWEDPFILEKDPKEYKKEKERSKEEIEKRLGYVLPVIDFLLNESLH